MYLLTTILIPLFSEAILLFRVVAVYPPRTIALLHSIAVYGPIAAFKLSRLVNFALYIAQWVPKIRKDPSNIILLGQTSWGGVILKIEWLLMLVDIS